MQVIGNSIFSGATGAITSAAFIRGSASNGYSTSSTPEYTWYNEDGTGFFHPGPYVLGISLNGTEKMRLAANGFGIGTTSPASLLSVGGSGSSNYLAYFYNSSTAASAQAISASIASPTGSNNAYCINGSLTSGAGYAYGIRGSSANASSQTAGQALGVYGQASNASTGYNYGVAGILLGSNYGTGIYGSDYTTAGVTTIPNNYAGYFSGKIRTTNDAPEKPTSGSWTGYSDIRLKKDTASFKDGLNVIRKIHPVTYKFNGTGNLSLPKLI